MATRQVEFTASLVDTSTLPTAVDATTDDDVPNYGQTARRDSWFDSQADNTAVKAIAVADRTDQQVVFNDAAAAFYYFDSGSAAADDGDLVLAPDTGSGRWIKITGGTGSSTADIVTRNFDDYVATIRAGETLAIRDAVSLVQFDQDGFLMVKSDADITLRKRSFAGLADTAATVTQGVYTLTLDAALVTGNVISVDVNGNTYTETYASSSDETLDNLADQINGDPNVQSAASVQVGGDKLGSDDRVININSSNGINTQSGSVTILVDNISVTGGASQPGLVFGTTTPAAGDTIQLTAFGPQTGHSGLDVGKKYYLSGTAGAITTAPTDSDSKYVGIALSATVFDVNQDEGNHDFSSLLLFIKSHGNGSSAANGSGGQNNVEHYDFITWSTGTAEGTSLSEMTQGQGTLSGMYHVTSGLNTGDTVVNNHRSYNSLTWSTKTAIPNPVAGSYTQELLGKLEVFCGTANSNAASAQDRHQTWNGSSWNNQTPAPGSPAAPRYNGASFTRSGLMSAVAGENSSGTALSSHVRYNGTTWSSSTGFPATTHTGAGASTQAGGICNDAGTTSTYEWNGTSWSSSKTGYNVTDVATNSGNAGGCGGYDGGTTTVFNGGDVGGTNLSTTQHYDGAAWSSQTSSATNRGGVTGAVIS